MIADYNTVPFIVGLDENRVPRLADVAALQSEFALSNNWHYLGSVHRTEADELHYFSYDKECQEFATEYIGTVLRKTTRCKDSNYTSG